MTEELGTILGIDFSVHYYKSDGFQLTLRHAETGEIVWDNRMISYSLGEAIIKACHDVWADEIEREDDQGLPLRIALALMITESHADEDED